MQRRSFGWVLGAAIALAACHTGQRAEQQVAPDELAPRVPHGKPQAPVDVRMETRPSGGDSYEVTLVATPHVAVKSLELALDGRTTMVGPTAAGQRRTVTTRVSLGQLRGREIVGSAAVDVGTHRRRAAATAQLGEATAAVAPPYRIVRLPDGTDVAEVRP
jgi:hypothetical protein